MAAELHVGDIGTQFIFTLKDQDDAVVNISAATTLQVLFRKPSCTLLTRDATLYTDGTDGKFIYTTVSGDFDEAGSYKIQGYVVISSNEWHTNYFTEKVHRNIG
jgi:hypothetical protein